MLVFARRQFDGAAQEEPQQQAGQRVGDVERCCLPVQLPKGAAVRTCRLRSNPCVMYAPPVSSALEGGRNRDAVLRVQRSCEFS